MRPERLHAALAVPLILAASVALWALLAAVALRALHGG